MGAFILCVGACLAAVPWWVWLVVALAGAIIGAVTYLVGLVLGGGGAIVVNALVKAAIIGLVGGVLAPVGACLLSCIPG